jgi:hypothetical protein
MKTKLLAAASGAIVFAFATGVMANPVHHTDTDISQFLTAAQTALDNIQIGHDASGAVSQTAINAGNLLDLSDEYSKLGDVNQTDFAWQLASNYASSFRGSFDDLTQAATNVANSISAVDKLDNVNQLALAPQLATNFADAASYTGNVKQTATNVANSIDDVTDASGIKQVAGGPQIASNKIGYDASHFFLSDDVALNARQSATNVSNIATVDTLADFSTQVSGSLQVASNATAYFGSPHFLQVPDSVGKLTQDATNATNILSLGADLPGSHSFLPELSQTATGAQLAQNLVIAPSLTDKVTQTATNVANSISSITGGDE